MVRSEVGEVGGASAAESVEIQTHSVSDPTMDMNYEPSSDDGSQAPTQPMTDVSEPSGVERSDSEHTRASTIDTNSAYAAAIAGAIAAAAIIKAGPAAAAIIKAGPAVAASSSNRCVAPALAPTYPRSAVTHWDKAQCLRHFLKSAKIKMPLGTDILFRGEALKRKHHGDTGRDDMEHKSNLEVCVTQVRRASRSGSPSARPD